MRSTIQNIRDPLLEDTPVARVVLMAGATAYAAHLALAPSPEGTLSLPALAVFAAWAEIRSGHPA